MPLCSQKLVEFRPFVIMILSGNKILTIIKGHDSVTNERKLAHNNPNLVNINAYMYTKFGKVQSICPQENHTPE